jgi:hypothetical protein
LLGGGADGRRPFCVVIADIWSEAHLEAMTITADILAQLKLSEIDSVIFYKRDALTTDLICCDVEVHGQVWTFHEETIGWNDLTAHLSGLPGIVCDWHGAVINPPFAMSETVAYRRR